VHEFSPDSIETRWTARVAGAGRTADVLFPSWGRSATVTAVLADGTSVPIGRDRRSLDGVRWLYVHSARSGYVIVPRDRPRGATLRLLHPRSQSSAPLPGPTLAVGLAGSARRSFAARIATVAAHDDAERVAVRIAR
jgi:hypothetical protein